MKSNDFNNIAFYYDLLARLIFGRSIRESQIFFLSEIPDRSSVLILGGGTGWILKELLSIRPQIEVCYIESSSKMIFLAQRNFDTDRRIRFIHGTEDDIPNQQFGALITGYYLDLFNENSLKEVLKKIKVSLAPGAKWLVIDFVQRKWWHKIMLSMMYFFFKLIAKIEAENLPDWNNAMGEIGGRKTNSKFFYSGFIEATVFQF